MKIKDILDYKDNGNIALGEVGYFGDTPEEVIMNSYLQPKELTDFAEDRFQAENDDYFDYFYPANLVNSKPVRPEPEDQYGYFGNTEEELNENIKNNRAQKFVGLRAVASGKILYFAKDIDGEVVPFKFYKGNNLITKVQRFENIPQYEIDHERNVVYKTTGDFKYEEQIEDIMREFDWSLSVEIMRLIDIERTEEEMRKIGRGLLENAVTKGRSACGGLCAVNISGILSLHCDVCEWEACIEQDVITTTCDLDILRDNCDKELE